MTDVVIIGAGIVGLATAYNLLSQYPHLQVTILEKESRVATHQSSRNSGVVHSGVYYKPGSLKAHNCIRGRKLLLDFCNTHNISLEKMGKVIVATHEKELANLHELHKRAQGNNIEASLISPEQLREIEPHAAGIRALFVPSCFSIHFANVAEALYQEILKKGATIHLNEEVLSLNTTPSDVTVTTTKATYKASFLINCAGLYSDSIAALIFGKKSLPFHIIPFRGEYWEVKPEKKHLVKGLIYPVPDPKFPFLGVHLSKMVDGKVLAGPNAILALAKEGYTKTTLNLPEIFHYLTYKGFWKMASRFWNVGAREAYRSLSKSAFGSSVRKLVPEIQDSDLIPALSGVRAQAVKPDGTLLDDFAFLEHERTLHVLNAPSPAATSCLSIGETIAQKVAGKLYTGAAT